MPKENVRTKRVADLIQKELAQILLREAKDSRFGLLSISNVAISKDLSFAKINITLLGETIPIKEVLKSLNNSAGYFRTLLAKTLQLRIVPKIAFYYDDSLRRGSELSVLINEAVAKDQKKSKD
jgi:ribosome-binding factor A